MRQAEMLSITQAARSAGVSVDLVRSQIEQGSIEATRDRDGQWLLPIASVESLARMQALQLDLRGPTELTNPPSQSDILAAQAAVLLARTQATAARFQSEDFLRRLRDANHAAAADRKAREQADEALAQAERSLAELRRDQAVAEAKVQELRRQLANDERHFQFMVDRIASLEWERQRLTQSLGWLGRIRYQRTAAQDSPTAAVEPIGQPLVADRAGDPIDAPLADHTDARRYYPRPVPSPAPAPRPATMDALATVQNMDAIA